LETRAEEPDCPGRHAIAVRQGSADAAVDHEAGRVVNPSSVVEPNADLCFFSDTRIYISRGLV
jgi:hypothetical protein